MALSLITDISATCYTSQLQKIELVSSGSAVEFRIYYQAQTYYSGNGQTLIFSASYNTRLSHVAIYDIGSLLETYLADRDGVQQFIFYFSNGTDSLEQTYAVIYCKQQPVLSAADLASSNYITNYLTRLVYRGAQKKNIDFRKIVNEVFYASALDVRDKMTTLLEAIYSHPGMRVSALQELISVPEKTLERYIKTLKEANFIEYRGAKKTGGYFISGSHSKDDEGINEGINEL